MQFTLNPFTHRLDAFEQSINPGGHVETLTGDSGGAVGPNASQNIFILGGPGIDVVGTPGTYTLTVSANGGIEGTGQTVGAVTADLLTFPLGAVPGVYLFKISVAGFDPTTPAGASFSTTGCIRTTGAVGMEISNQITDEFKEGGLVACNCDLIASVNNAIVRVTGTAGKTINWRAVLTYTLRV